MRVAFRIYVPRSRGIKIYDRMDWCRDSGETSYSQSGQDFFVLNCVFPGKRDGVFVDVGANHPVNWNNSYLLERSGWSGLAIEPQDSLNELWPDARETKCLNCVIGSENGSVEFVEATEEQHGLSGVAGYNKVAAARTTIVKQQRRLDDLLMEHGIKEVDVLFIDVEGYEMHVLSGIDFSKIRAKCIVVENDRGLEGVPYIGHLISRRLGSNTIRRYLKGRNYRQVARIYADDVFVLRPRSPSLEPVRRQLPV